LEFADSFGIGLAYDLPDTKLSVAAHVLNSWGIELADAIDECIGNLEPVDPGYAFGEIKPGLWVSICEDTYDSTRLIATDIVRSYPVDGDPLALIISRSVVFLTGSNDVDNICELPALADEARADYDKTFREVPIVLRENDCWESWYDPELQLPLEIEQWFSRNETSARASDFTDQSDILRELFLLQRKAVNVPDVGVLNFGDLKLTICKWETGEDACLPFCQLVGIPVDTDGNYAVTGLIDLWEEFPDHFEETDYFPARVNVRRSLTSKQLKSYLAKHPDTHILQI
jgi:hypothetical protein